MLTFPFYYYFVEQILEDEMGGSNELIELGSHGHQIYTHPACSEPRQPLYDCSTERMQTHETRE